MEGNALDDGWIELKATAHGQNTLSWATSISRTRVSTVDGLRFSENLDTDMVGRLGSLLFAVQKMKLKRFPAESIKRLRVVGEGETFSVFEAKFQQEVIAVKRIRLYEKNASVSRTAVQRRLQAVLKEILIMNHPPLAHHSNIVRLLGYGWEIEQQQLSPFITVELAPAGSLRNYLRDSAKPFRTKEILASDIASGLMALHKCGIIHGDLKLDNVLVVPSLDRPCMATARIADFGHSIILNSATEADLHYFGTGRYNAPEVRRQRQQPIAAEQLHKCDIWAYGLSVWEILADGQTCFRYSGREDSDSCRLGSPHVLVNTCLGIDDVRSPPDDSHLPPPFNHADLNNLARDFVNALILPGLGLERKFLLALFEHTLQVDPARRISDLSRLPIMNASKRGPGGHTLQSGLAALAMADEIRYSIFTREICMHIPWQHQRMILSDLETEATSHHSFKNRAAAAFQAMLCYTNSFGSSKDYTKAATYLRQANDAGHILARTFGPRIEDGLLQLKANSLPTYSECLALGFRISNQPDKLSSLIVLFPKTTLEFPDYQSFKKALALDLPSTYAEYGDISSIIGRINGRQARYNLLELAVGHDDSDLVRDILAKIPEKVASMKIQQWPVICRAACCGSLETLKLLAKHWQSTGSPDILLLLHWFFCFSAREIDTLLQIMEAVCGDKARLERALNRSITPSEGSILHLQWPFQVCGTPLGIAVTAGNVAAVQALLYLGANPLAPVFMASEDELMANLISLHLAVKYSFSDIFHLLWKSAFPNREVTTNLVCSTAHLRVLPLASVIPSSTIAERLAIHGSGYLENLGRTVRLFDFLMLRQQAPDGRSAITEAIDGGDVDGLQALLTHCPELARTKIRFPGGEGLYTYPLHFATQIWSESESTEHLNIIRCILHSDPFAIDRPDGSTFKPIHLAAMGISVPLVELLLERGASVASIDRLGRTPLHFCRTGSIARLLHYHGAVTDHRDSTGLSAVHMAARQGNEDVIQALLHCGAGVNITDHHKWTALHYAMEGQHHRTAKLLAECGISLDAQNQHGKTALHMALYTEQYDLAKTLLNLGANPCIRDASGSSPFFLSIIRKNAPILERILEHPEIHSLPHATLTGALLTASVRSDAEGLTVFLKSLHPLLAQYNLTDRSGGLPVVHHAAASYRVDLVKVLLSHGFSVDSLDPNGSTPLILVCNGNPAPVDASITAQRDKTCEFLLHEGADIRAAFDGQTPFSIAVENKDCSLMAVLLRHALPPTQQSNASFLKSWVISICEDGVWPRSSRYQAAMWLSDNKTVSGEFLRHLIDENNWELAGNLIGSGLVAHVDIQGIFYLRWFQDPETIKHLFKHRARRWEQQLFANVNSPFRKLLRLDREIQHRRGHKVNELETLRVLDFVLLHLFAEQKDFQMLAYLYDWKRHGASGSYDRDRDLEFEHRRARYTLELAIQSHLKSLRLDSSS